MVNSVLQIGTDLLGSLRLWRRLTIRSSRPRIVASATCLRYASTRPPPRCGAA